ncbi:MAG: M24 family metallopeptidase [Chlamydiales bacterium]|nr:M24 family metallopeptidase [Chlamydiales bacterium]
MAELLEKITKAKNWLLEHEIDGWLLYSFQTSNDICLDFLQLSQDLHQTRRFFYFISKTGEITAIVHFIEKHLYAHLPGSVIVYKSCMELDQALASIIKGKHRICMEYSHYNAIPYLSKVDAGIWEKVTSFGVKVVSSGEILGEVFSKLSLQEYQSHLDAAKNLEEIVSLIPSFVQRYMKKNKIIYEIDLQDFILEEFHKRNLETEGKPICAAQVNSSNPHYQIVGKGKKIEPQGILLVDLWAKLKEKKAVFADTTKMFYLSKPVENKVKEMFSLVRDAQRCAVEFIQQRLTHHQMIKGYEVDQVAREWISSHGYGAYFVHRLGHNIERELHGRGTHLDSFETIDDRVLQSNTLFSIEPGIYLPGEFGIRLELNAYIDHDQINITTKLQDDLLLIM